MIMIQYLLGLIVLATAELYTNEKAMTCFQEEAMQKCGKHFKTCVEDKACDHQLEHYQRCHFGLKEHEGPHVFNGYCFRKWRENAVRSKEVIDCLYETCNLGYNSDVGYQIMYKCSEMVMMADEVECEEACLDQMSHLIGNKMRDMPLADLYSQKFQNPQVAKITSLLIDKCVNDSEEKREVEGELMKLHREWFQNSRPQDEGEGDEL